LEIVFTTFPKADIYTLYTDYQNAGWAKKYQNRIKTTFLQKFYSLGVPKQLFAPLMPMAVESLDLSYYDTVFSISSAFIKGAITRPETKHYCYLFSPTRFLWHEEKQFASSALWQRPFLTALRQWDKIASSRPDKIYTLSRFSQGLIKKYYRLDAQRLLPPFDKHYWQKISAKKPRARLPKQFFLIVSRLEPQKNIALAVKAFSQKKSLNLVVAGKGTRLEELKKKAGPNIIFLNFVSDKELAWLYQKAKALIMPQREDFGYTALEALAFATPVICYQNSGAAELIKDGQNGYLFKKNTTKSLISALENCSTKSYNFAKFDWTDFAKERFVKSIKKLLI